MDGMQVHLHSSPVVIAMLLALATLTEASTSICHSCYTNSGKQSSSKPPAWFSAVIITAIVLFFPVLFCGLCCCAHIKRKRRLKREAVAAGTSARQGTGGVPPTMDPEAQRSKMFGYVKEEDRIRMGVASTSYAPDNESYGPPPEYQDPEENLGQLTTHYAGPLYTYPPPSAPPPHTPMLPPMAKASPMKEPKDY